MAAPIRTAPGVLFLCTGNSARSILAECLLARIGESRFRSYSAGSHPKPAPHPAALALLRRHGYATDTLRSKSWDEFTGPDAPQIDLVFTVCDNAAGESCPVWPGHPLTAHWGIPDPADVVEPGDEQRRAFEQAYAALEQRIRRFTRLPLENLSAARLEAELRDIGVGEPHTNQESGPSGTA